MATKHTFDPESLVAHALRGCTPDTCRGLHLGLGLAEAQAQVEADFGLREVRRDLEEITYGGEGTPTPVESVALERTVELGGVEFTEHLMLSEVRRPRRSVLSATWLFKTEGAIGKTMPKVAREVKRRLSELLAKGDSKSDFRLRRAGRTETVFVSHGPDFLSLTHGDDDF